MQAIFRQISLFHDYLEDSYLTFIEGKIASILFIKILPMEQRESRGNRRAKNKTTITKIEQDVDILKLTDDLKKKGSLTQDIFLKIVSEASAILQNQPTLLKIISPVVIVGDIHGQFYDLLKIFEKVGPVSNNTYLFLGDYVDRGKFCIQVLTLLLKLKKLYPNNIFLLRGNHEGRTMTTFFNFKLQCQKKYNTQVYETIIDLFKKIPLCALIDNKYFAVHGGISPKLNHLYEIQRINRFVEISEDLPMSDLLWSDPSDNRSDSFAYNKLRCCSYIYSPVQSEAFLKNNQLNLIIRGHQVASKGYKYQTSANNTPLTLTIFSAPNYCDTYHNQAVIAFLKNNQIELKAFKQSPHPLVLDNYMNVFEFTLPMFSSNITQIFKHLLKCTQKISKKRTSHQRREDLQTIKNVQIIQEHFSTHSNQLLKFLLSHVQEKEDPLEQAKDGVFNEEMLMRFLAMKASDVAEKMPTIFGPRNIEFKKVNISLKNLNQIDPEQEKCNQFQF